jgi:hypothetical protein
MNNVRKVMLSAAAALGVAVSAQAQYANGDLLVGFTGGPSDFILDLGPSSSLSLGQTWTVPANVGTEFGVVGALNFGRVIFATSADSAENSFNPQGLFTSARANVATLAQGNLTAGLSISLAPSLTYSWTYQTAQPAGTAGNTFENNFFNPNVSVGSKAYLFENADSGTVTPLNSFSYNSASGELSYQAVPEPGTVSLLAVMGLLGATLRRRLVRRAA